jgi:hypothetical protein
MNTTGEWQRNTGAQRRNSGSKNYGEQSQEFRPEGKHAQYRTSAMAFIEAKKAMGQDPCFAIVPETEEWRAWETYFLDRHDSLPWEMKAVLQFKIPSATVPTRWPDDFKTYEDATAQHERNLGRDPQQAIAPVRKPYRPVERVKGGRDIPDSTRALIAKLTGNDAYLRS